MTDFQAEKALVAAHHAALAAANPGDAAAALARHTHPDWHWRGMCPFDEKTGAEAVAEAFWTPLLTALTSLQRREDIFFAGLNEIDGFTGTWVVSMGHLMGLFRRAMAWHPAHAQARHAALRGVFTAWPRGGSSRRHNSSTSRI